MSRGCHESPQKPCLNFRQFIVFRNKTSDIWLCTCLIKIIGNSVEGVEEGKERGRGGGGGLKGQKF